MLTKNERKRRIKSIISPLVIYPLYWFYKLLTSTLRYTEIGREKVDKIAAEGNSVVLGLWHDELFPLMKMQRHLEIVTVVSPSVDGDFLANLLNKLKVNVVRGSSTRKGMSALLNAVKLMKSKNMHAVVTLDGPLGPRHEVKEGALFLAFHAKGYIVPTRLTMEKCYTFNTWDKFKLPYPFSKVKVEYFPPYKIDSDTLNSEVLLAEKEKLQQILKDMVNEKD